MVVTKLGHNQIVTSFYTGVTVVSASMLYMRGISVLNLNGWPLSLRKGLLGWGTEAVAAEKVRGSFTSPSLWSHQLSLLLYRWYLLLLLSLPEISDSKRLELVCASSEPLLSRCEGRRCLLLQVTLFCNLLRFLSKLLREFRLKSELPKRLLSRSWRFVFTSSYRFSDYLRGTVVSLPSGASLSWSFCSKLFCWCSTFRDRSVSPCLPSFDGVLSYHR